MLRAQNKISKRTFMSDLALIRSRGTGGQWGHVPHHFIKVKKMPFWGARKKVPFLQ